MNRDNISRLAMVRQARKAARQAYHLAYDLEPSNGMREESEDMEEILDTATVLMDALLDYEANMVSDLFGDITQLKEARERASD